MNAGTSKDRRAAGSSDGRPGGQRRVRVRRPLQREHLADDGTQAVGGGFGERVTDTDLTKK
jgi:hypothetical protein